MIDDTRINEPTISDTARLEAIVGGRPLPSLLKSIDELDEHCVGLLALSPAGVIGYTDADGRARSAVVGGDDGFGRALSPEVLAMPAPSGMGSAAVGTPISTVFLVPGLGETLRVNGHLRSVADGTLEVDVTEAFAHCAKCVIRSKLWADPSGADPSDAGPSGSASVGGPVDGPLAADGVADLLARCPFVVLTTRDASGAADASPKGDPPGFVQLLGGSRVAIPDRPGNHRTDTFHNLIDDPFVGVLGLVPGEARVVELSGRGHLTDDPELLATMAVKGRPPKIAMVIDVERAWVHAAPELDEAGLWDPDRRVPESALPNMNQVWVDHVKRSKEQGEIAEAIRAGISEPGLREGIALDYEHNLY